MSENPGGRSGERRTSAPLLLGSHAGRQGRFVIGTLRRHPLGYAFLEPLSGGRSDLYLPAEEARRALDGDLVRVEVVRGRRGRPAARLVEVVERRRTRAVGIYVTRGGSPFVVPADRALGEAIAVEPSRHAQDGDTVKVSVSGAPSRGRGLTGDVISVLGAAGDPMAEMLEVAYGNGFSDEFPLDASREASRVLQTVSAHEAARRRDLRALRLVTIDGEDARDFDDAVYVERLRQGYRLVVAIADVSFYVKPGTALDHEALRRGTSVYFPSVALPMLPEALSNGICSLRPGEDRLCMVADLILEPSGPGVRCVNAELYEGVMRSAARCTYTEVAAVLGGKRVPHRESFREDFELMEELTRRLMAGREQRGAIDFDLPEAKVVLDERRRPVRMERRDRTIAHRIIEELMLAANEAVAHTFSVHGLPTVWRVHGEPDEEKLGAFLALARAHGFALEAGTEISGKALNALLKRIAGSPEQRTLNFLLLRSMMQAIYSVENRGHFGLAAPFYLHFTSPIRRYPDLMVHRLLREHWARGMRALGPEERGGLEERLDGISARCSERERAAMAAEREVASYFAALLMQDKIGEEYQGTVTAVTDFGLFVELKDVFVEGLIKAASIAEGAKLDTERHRLAFPSGLSFGLGTAVRVRLTNVNVGRRHIDFELLSVAGQKPVQRVGAEREPLPSKFPRAEKRPRSEKGRKAKRRRRK